jgi:hypothetical protein
MTRVDYALLAVILLGLAGITLLSLLVLAR